jgi:hypothetical protein
MPVIHFVIALGKKNAAFLADEELLNNPNSV